MLKKYDGQTWTDNVTKDFHVRKRYRIVKLPRVLLLHLVRFTKNNFYLEKNPTIVTFPGLTSFIAVGWKLIWQMIASNYKYACLVQ